MTTLTPDERVALRQKLIEAHGWLHAGVIPHDRRPVQAAADAIFQVLLNVLPNETIFPPTPRPVETAAQALVERMEEIIASSAYRSVLTISQTHVGPYAGPNWQLEFEALKAALAATEGGKHKDEQVGTPITAPYLIKMGRDSYCKAHGYSETPFPPPAGRECRPARARAAAYFTMLQRRLVAGQGWMIKKDSPAGTALFAALNIAAFNVLICICAAEFHFDPMAPWVYISQAAVLTTVIILVVVSFALEMFEEREKGPVSHAPRDAYGRLISTECLDPWKELEEDWPDEDPQ